MTAPRDLSCPVCRADITIEQLFSSEEAQIAFNELVRISIPMGLCVLAYLTLFAPAKNRLNVSRKVNLINELLPDLRRQSITRSGRDWMAPPSAWSQAIEQMEAARDAGRLQLPLTSHAYLYTILQGIAEKWEGKAEAQREADRRGGAHHERVQLRGESVAVADAMDSALANLKRAVDPALAKLQADAKSAAPMPPAVREQIAAIKRSAPGSAS